MYALSTQTAYFEGPCKWAKLIEPDEYNDSKKWKINVYLSKEDIKRLKGLGSKLKVNEDDDGQYVTFSRPTEKEVKGNLIEMQRPWVCSGPDGKEEDFEEPVGNGSKVKVKVSIYDTRMGKGHTLEAVKVIDHVAYEDTDNLGETKKEF